jgi:hypothetical protein
MSNWSPRGQLVPRERLLFVFFLLWLHMPQPYPVSEHCIGRIKRREKHLSYCTVVCIAVALASQHVTWSISWNEP